MIELSKCPTCASEDKVTIAGKDFCMRCGTPAPDVNSPAEAAAVANQQPDAGGVTKFADTPAPATNEPVQVPSQPQPPIQPQASTEPQQPMAPPTPPAPEMPANPNPPTDPVSTPQHIAPPVPENAQPQPTSEPQPPISPGNIPQSMAGQPVANQAEMVATSTTGPATSQIPIAQPNSIPQSNSPQVDSATTTTQPAPQPMAQPPQAPPALAPEPMQMSDQPLTMPTEPPQITEPEPPKITSHSMPMNLETHDDSGVFSDAQLEALSKSTEAPIDLQRPDKQAGVDASKPNSHTTPTPAHTAESHTADTPAHAAVSKVAENEIKDPIKKSKSKKALKPAGIALSIVALFIVGAYIWQVNYPTLAFKIASAKAGMSASMPGYIPGGYKLAGEIQTNPGAVTYNLINDGQDKKISISQTKTDWDSQALAENYVAPKAENYLALQAQGLTIYMLGENQATWVNKGTWYKIESPSQSLSQDQAIKIATSL